MSEFKRAIENADWESICKIYEGYTGKKIKPPIFSVIPIEEEQEKNKKNNNSGFRTSKQQSIKFVELKEIPKDDPNLYINHSRIKRSDLGIINTGKNIKVTCSKCNREESVSPGLAIGYSKNPEDNMYSCNSCSMKRR